MSIIENSIGWLTVANTVASRLVDTSLIHELLPSRKLQKRTKALNAALTKKSSAIPYSQYIEIKAAFSQGLSDDVEIDDNISFTEEDYESLCKDSFTVVTGRDNLIQMPSQDMQSQHQDYNTRSDKSMIKIKSRKYHGTAHVNKIKNTAAHSVNVGWQKIIKKGNKTVCSQAFNYDRDASNQDTLSFNKIMSYAESFQDDSSLNPLDIPLDEASTLELCTSLRNTASSNRQYGAFTNILSTGTKAEDNQKRRDAIESSENVCQYISNQPKDSGIDEDFEEEPSNYKNTDHKGTDERFYKVSCNVQTSSDTKFEENLRNVTTLDEPVDGNIINIDNQEHKLQPRVTCAEIVNTRYKIVSTDTSSLRDCELRKVLKNIRQSGDDKISECLEEEVDAADCVSPAIARRLRQLRSLNLTVDDDDSDCADHEREEEVAPNDRFIEKPRETLSVTDERVVHGKWKKKRKKEFNETSIEELDMNSAEQCVVSRRKKKLDFNLSMERSNKVTRHHRNYEDNVYSENDESAEKQSTRPLTENILDRSSYRANEIGNNKENTPYRHDLSTEAENGSTYDCDMNDLDGRTDSVHDKHKRLLAGTANVTSEMQISNTHSMTQKRPCNLPELMETEGLIEETSPAAISLKNLLEDDMFILEIPKTVLQHQLLGKKFVLTEEKLKMGKQKYKATFKYAEAVSCVFSTGESRKPYKTVNIKPSARILAFKKMLDNTVREISS